MLMTKKDYPDVLRQRLGYVAPPFPEKCCKNCSFCNLDDYNNIASCVYMNAIDAFKDIEIIDIHACCKHFISHSSAKLIRDCKSPEELQMKTEIFGIELDPLLLAELQDGFKFYERATKKMLDYASAIHDTLAPMDKEAVPWPLAISCKHLYLGEEYDIDAMIGSPFNEETEFQTSENFSRIHAYIKGNKPVYDVMRCAANVKQAVTTYASNCSRGQIKETDADLKNYFKSCAI